MRDLERLLKDGLKIASDLGGSPVAVVPSDLSTLEAPTLIIADDLIDARFRKDHGCTSDVSDDYDAVTGPANPRLNSASTQVLVFPGSKEQLNGAIVARRLPATSRALVLENGHWEDYVPLRTATSRPGARGMVSWLRRRASHRKTRVLTLLQRLHWARRIQPMVDRSEGVIPDVLASAPGFRILKPVERRIVLAIGQLGGGGAERQMVNTLEGLKQRGLEDVHMMLLDGLGINPHGSHYEKARRLAAGIHAVSPLAGPGDEWIASHPELDALLLRQILAAAITMARIRPEIVQISLDWPNVIFGLAAVLSGVPRIIISGRNLAPHHFEFFQWFMFPCYRALMATPNVLITNNSEAGRDSYARWLRREPRSITIIRNGMQVDEFQPPSADQKERVRGALGIDDKVPVITGAFRLSAEKRPLLWIDAAARIKCQHPDAVFLLCGVGGLAEAIEARAKANGLDSSLRMLGERSDIAAIFAATDVVMHTSIQEGTPNTLIEAQGMGVPVVTTPAFGAAEAVEDGITGLIVHDSSAAALAGAVISILERADFRVAVSNAGPAWVRRRFGMQRMIDDTLAAYALLGATWAGKFLSADRKYCHKRALTNIKPQKGLCWRAPVPEIEWLADNESNPMCSPLLLFEDDNLLIGGHSGHNAIRTKGRGTYSHWGNMVYFSSSDGTSPLTNGRTYSIAVPLQDEAHGPETPLEPLPEPVGAHWSG
jgi:glycosyltransferase involved in cell wall biosynthesis